MGRPHRKWLPVAVFVAVAAVICAVLWRTAPDEPSYGGNKLSAWLDELRVLNHPAQWDPETKQAKAVRAIGTNAIPWLLHEIKATEPSGLQWRLNKLLARQSIIKYRFLDANTRRMRACRGFEALGQIAEPAIPELMRLVEVEPGFVPAALAAIGPPAVPALQQCMTNYYSCVTSVGRIVPIPDNTIGAIYNAINGGRLSNSHAAVFLPAVRAWAQSTNRNPAVYDYAKVFLKDFDR